MADTPQIGQAAPSGTDSGGGGTITPEQMKQFMQLLQPHKELNEPSVRPGAKTTGLGHDIGVGLLSMFVPALGGAIQKHAMLQKQAQINEAYSDSKQLHDSLEEAWILSKGDQQKAFQLWEQMPAYKDIFDPANPASKKKLKNYAKVFQVDWMNPEKTTGTAAYQGIQKFMQAYPQSKLIKALHQQMQGGQQMQQGAQQMAGGGQPQQQPQQGGQPMGQGQPGMGQRLPMHMAQPSPQIMEQLLKAGQQREEFQMTYERMRQQHEQDLNARLDNYRSLSESRENSHLDRLMMIDMRKDQYKSEKEYKAAQAEEHKRHDKELEKEAEERIQVTKEIADLRKQTLEGGKLKEEYKAGLRVLHTSLFGTGDPAAGGTKGLVDMLYVLDNPTSRLKLSTLGQDFIHPDSASGGGGPGIIGGLKRMLESKALSADEREFLQQLNRSIGAINALRTVTGLPRATQALMDRYILELPSAMMDANSEEANRKLLLIQREINAAMEQAAQQGATKTSEYEQYKRTGQPQQ